MFKYTPKKEVLRSLQVCKTGDWWNKEFFKRMEILKNYNLPQDYTLSVVLQRDFAKVQYYSAKPVKCVPVRGYLFPAEMFNEQMV